MAEIATKCDSFSIEKRLNPDFRGRSAREHPVRLVVHGLDAVLEVAVVLERGVEGGLGGVGSLGPLYALGAIGQGELDLADEGVGAALMGDFTHGVGG